MCVGCDGRPVSYGTNGLAVTATVVGAISITLTNEGLYYGNIQVSKNSIIQALCSSAWTQMGGGTVMSNAAYGELGYIEQVYSTIVLSQDQAFSGVVMA